MAKKAKPGRSKTAPKRSDKGTGRAGIKIERVVADDIVVVKERFRKINQKTVDELADSIEQLSLIHPPTVYYAKPKGESEVKMYLNSGQHRLAAVKKLGWKEIDVIIVEKNKRKNAMRRSSENLHRNPLSKQEEGQEVLNYLEHRFAEEGGQAAQPHDKGISAAAKKFGRSRRTIKRLILAGAI